MDDIAPLLLEAISRDFLEILGEAELQQLDYIGAAEYAERVGAALAEAFRRNLGGDALPDGRMYWNIADRVVRPMLEQDHRLVSDAAVRVQQALNEAAGIGLKAQAAPLEPDRVNGILNKLAAAEHYDDVAWVLDEPVRTFTRAVVDETLRRNVEFQGKAGLAPKIIRRAESHCCEWCSKLDGVYEYPDVPRDIYRRHEHCRCTVEYDPGSGKRQNVHTKKWTEPGEELEKRKAIEGIDTKPRVRESPKQKGPENVLPEYLRTATPGRGSITFDDGYRIPSHSAEIKTAQWLHDHLGGDIVLLQENLGGAKKPDYVWHKKLWELKSISSAKAADSAVRGALKQIIDDPGGIIIDCGANEMSIANLLKVIDARIERSSTFSVDILVLSKDILLTALRYKK